MLLPLRRLCPSCGEAEITEHGQCTDCWAPRRRGEAVRRTDAEVRRRMGLPPHEEMVS